MVITWHVTLWTQGVGQNETDVLVAVVKICRTWNFPRRGSRATTATPAATTATTATPATSKAPGGACHGDPRDQRDPRSVPRPRPPGASGVPAPPSWSLEREPREPREPRPARTVLRNNITKSSPKLNEKNIRRRGAETIQWWCMRMPWGNIVGKCGKEDADTYHLS